MGKETHREEEDTHREGCVVLVVTMTLKVCTCK